MRWPDLFFKSRKAGATPKIATVPATPDESTDALKPGAPAKTETAKVGAAMSERDKTESLRALAEVDNERAPLPDTTSAKPAPTPAEIEAGNAKTAMLPAVTRAGSTLSLRQRAKLTDDARVLPKREPESGPTPGESGEKLETLSAAARDTTPLPGPAPAVVPAAFTVPVETGTVMESSTDKPDEPESKANPQPTSLQDKEPARPPTPSEEPPSSDTARVHLAPATTKPEPDKESDRETEPAPATALDAAKPADPRPRQEFVLANGERILGHVLSETPQTIYLEHGTLGVLTLPRSQVAGKPIEVILINGDRIVGDLIAETSECLYIKHASLGMVTVPHSQRSTRVVEAILKDGDRILGEVLAETELFTVIRSATLGTVAVQHEQVAMLNRKIEQMQLRALPGATPAIGDKKD